MFDVAVSVLGALGIFIFGIWLPIRLGPKPDPATPALSVVTPAAPRDGGLSVLPRRLFWFALCTGVGLFTVLLGPVWTGDYDVDRAVVWSYLPIPVIVGVGLRWARRWRFSAWVFGTFEVVLWKFAITATMVVVTWAVWGPAPTPPAAPLAPSWTPRAVHPARVPAPPGARVIRGQVVDDQDRPIPGALVYVGAGLEAYRYPPVQQPAVLSNDGEALTPGRVVLRKGQPLELVPTDGRLHTAQAKSHRRQVFNLPFVAGSTLALPAGPGWLTVGCAVHPEERPARVLVLDHPYWTWTDAAGRFAFPALVEGVELQLVAWSEADGESCLRLPGAARDDVRLVVVAGESRCVPAR